MQPRVTLEGLPLEIKTRIVEMCAEQDQRLKVMIAEAERRAINDDDAVFETLVETFTAPSPVVARSAVLCVVDLVGAGCASSVHGEHSGALLTRCSVVLIRLVKQVLKLSKAHSPTFRFRVAPLRSRHFRQLVRDKPAEDDEDNYFQKRDIIGDVLTLRLANVDNIVMTSDAAPALYLVHHNLPWCDLDSPRAYIRPSS